MKNTLIYMHLVNLPINFTTFKRLDLEFDYKEFEKQNNLKFVTFFDKEYPSQLTRLDSPPAVVTAIGNLELFADLSNSMSIIGQDFIGEFNNPSLDELVKTTQPSTIISSLKCPKSYPNVANIFVSDEPIEEQAKTFDADFLSKNLIITSAIPSSWITKNPPNNFTSKEKMIAALSKTTCIKASLDSLQIATELSNVCMIENEVILFET